MKAVLGVLILIHKIISLGLFRLMDVEKTFDVIGRFGSRQKLYFLLFGIKDVWLSFPIMHLVFANVAPKSFKCLDSQGKVHNNTCPQDDRTLCKSIEYNHEYNATSIISEWDLICDESYKSRLVQSIYMAGVLFGAIVFGYMSDALGRMKTYTITITMSWFFATISSFAPSFLMYCCVRFLCGMNIQGCTLSSYIAFIESIGSSKRGTVGSAMAIFFTFGLISISTIAYLIRNWRLMTFITSVWGLPFIFFFFCIFESPRWLLTNGLNKKAEEVMTGIAKGNGTLHKLPKNWRLQKSEEGTKSKNADSLLMFLTNGILFKRVAIQCYSWFVTGAMYYGITIGAGSLGDTYISNILLALVEIPAVLIQMFFLNRIGRRRLVCLFMTIGGASCLIIQFLPSNSNSVYIKTTLALIGKLCIAGQFGVIYIYSAELFPTSVRNGAIGMVSVASRMGGIICPFIVMLGDYTSNIHFTIFGVMGFTAGIANMWLPETNKSPLPDCIDNIINPQHKYKELSLMADVDELSDDEYFDKTMMLDDF